MKIHFHRKPERYYEIITKTVEFGKLIEKEKTSIEKERERSLRMKPSSTERTLPKPIGPVLYLAIELSQKNWKLGFTVGFGQSARLRNISARDIKSLQKEIQLAKKRFHLPEIIAVISCYEAGRDGFWIHRCLTSLGIMNLVVDSSSIEVNRRARRNKTDKLDVEKLLNMLMRYHHGEDKVWSVVNIPSEDIEDYHQLHRERGALQKERTSKST